MVKKRSIIEKMQNNPSNDWKISDIKAVCKSNGLELRAPTGGSHYTVISPHLQGILTIPAKRPIKSYYIKKFVSYTKAHEIFSNGDNND